MQKSPVERGVSVTVGVAEVRSLLFQSFGAKRRVTPGDIVSNEGL
jgi:hypothetical protein